MPPQQEPVPKTCPAPGIEVLEPFLLGPGETQAASRSEAAAGGTAQRAEHPCCEAVIIEVRRLRRLPAVVLNVRANLPASSWRVTHLHGPLNAGALEVDRLFSYLAQGTVRALPIPVDALPSDVHNRAWANLWVTGSDQFWTLFDRPYLMLFESDTVLCPQPSVPIEWWIGRHAYVGAPWEPRSHAGYHWCRKLACCVGNSGLSLWNRELVLQLMRKNLMGLGLHHFIDHWATTNLQARPAQEYLGPGELAVPSTDVAAAFSWELAEMRNSARIWETAAAANESLTWRRTQSWVPVGVHGVKGGGEWARGGCSALSTGAAGRLARARCERLLRACPPVLEISANSSLDGEAGDDSSEVAGSWRVAADLLTRRERRVEVDG